MRRQPVFKHVAGFALASLVAASLSGTAAAQGGLTLGEPAERPTLDLGPTAPGTTGTAAPTGPTRPPATRPADPAPGTGSPPPRAAAPTVDGEPVSREQFGDWEVACAASGECAMAQIGESADGVPVLEMVVRKLSEPLVVGDRTAIAVLDVVTPLGVVLTDGLGLSIDGADPEAAPFQICTEQGCLVREPIDDTLVARFKAGRQATVSVVAASQGEVSSTISLRGFTAGFGAL